MHIGALARATGRSIHTIRWYERQGLMRRVERDAGGRRIYRPEHVTWLHFLDRLRLTGLSIREMRAYALMTTEGTGRLGEQRELLERHRDVVRARQRELDEALALIEWKIDFYRRWEASGVRPSEADRPAIVDGETAAAGRSRATARGRRQVPVGAG